MAADRGSSLPTEYTHPQQRDPRQPGDHSVGNRRAEARLEPVGVYTTRTESRTSRTEVTGSFGVNGLEMHLSASLVGV